MSSNYTGLGRYEQLFDQLESRFEEIERRVTKLEVIKTTHRQQPYAGFDSGVNNAAWSPPPPPRRRRTCWDPPQYEQPLYSSFSRGNSSNYDTAPYQQPTRLRPWHEQPPGWPPPPPQRPSCRDPPRQQTNHCCPPPYIGPDRSPDSYVQPQNSYVQYRSWQPQYQPRSVPKVEDPINAELDHLLEVCDRKEPHVEATDHRGSKFRSLSQSDQPDVSSSRRTLEYPPSRYTMASRGQSGLYPNVSLASPRHNTTESTNLRPDFQPHQGNPSIQRRPLVFQQSDQPATRQPSCLESPLTTTIAAKQPDQNYQPPLPLPQSDRQPHRPSPSPPLELLPYAAPGPFQPLHSLPVTAPIAVSNLHPQAAIPSSMKKKWVTNIKEGEKIIEIENIIVEYKAAIETTKSDLIVERDELRLKSRELGDVTSMIHGPTSLDTDARLIPPRNNKSCLRNQGCVVELSVLLLNLDDHISLC